MQRYGAGTEHEAANLGERQAVGRGVSHHAAPDQHEQPLEVPAGHDGLPGQTQDGEQHELPADDDDEVAPADAAHAVQDASRAKPADQDRAEQKAGKREGNREFFQRGDSALHRFRCGRLYTRRGEWTRHC